jgi:hypothetical protein
LKFSFTGKVTPSSLYSLLRKSPICHVETFSDIHGPADVFWVVCGYRDAGVLRIRGPQPVVCSWLRRCLRFGIDLRISPGRLALRTGGGYLVFRRVATVVAANGLGRGEVKNLFKVIYYRRVIF